MWQKRGDLLNLVHALFVEVELCRQKFMVKPHRKRYWTKAVRLLKSAAYICDLYTGEQKQTRDFLRFYVESGGLRLAFDAGDTGQATKSIQSLQERANAVADAYSTGPVVERAIFLASMNQAEYHLRLKKTDRAYQHLKDAEQTISDVKWCTLEVQKNIVYVQTGLALARNDQKRQEYLAEYTDMFSLYPSLEHRRNLHELKQLYPKDVPEVFVLNGVSIYVDLMFRYLHPILLNV